MRWAYPKRWSWRTRRGFLWLPKTCGHETRWLEFAEWSEQFAITMWIPTEWIDAADKEQQR